MDSDSQLEHLAHKLNVPLVWVGTKDQLPSKLQNGGYICNLQDDVNSDGTQQHGTHWTAFIVENNGCAYMDSFGFPPCAQVQIFLREFLPFPYNAMQIQNTRSGHCGKYALYFLYFMLKHRKGTIRARMHNFSSLWHSDVSKNLGLLEAYLSAAKKNPL